MKAVILGLGPSDLRIRCEHCIIWRMSCFSNSVFGTVGFDSWTDRAEMGFSSRKWRTDDWLPWCICAENILCPFCMGSDGLFAIRQPVGVGGKDWPTRLLILARKAGSFGDLTGEGDMGASVGGESSIWTSPIIGSWDFAAPSWITLKMVGLDKMKF